MKTDLSYLESMTEGDAGLISEMIEIFSTQVIEFSGLMQQHLEQKDWQKLSKLAHKAKSSVSIMGMTELSEKLRNLETLAKEEKDVHSYPEYIDLFLTFEPLSMNQILPSGYVGVILENSWSQNVTFCLKRFILIKSDSDSD